MINAVMLKTALWGRFGRDVSCGRDADDHLAGHIKYEKSGKSLLLIEADLTCFVVQEQVAREFLPGTILNHASVPFSEQRLQPRIALQSTKRDV